MIIGATGIGKSSLAIQKAKEINAEIISADAFQVYTGMDIGTAKISKEEQKEVPHHLIDIQTPDTPYSVASFLEQCNVLIPDIQNRGKQVIICGGTALYTKAFLYQYEFEAESVPSEQYYSLLEESRSKDPHFLWEKLKQVDPNSAQKIPYQNHRRLAKALDYFYQKGTPISTRQHQIPRSDTNCIGISANRSMIYDRINKRVDQMIEKGLIEEVQTLSNQFPKSSPGFQGIGYKEVISYLDGDTTKEEMIDCIKKRTRQFAKRQLTWYRTFEHVKWIDATE